MALANLSSNNFHDAITKIVQSADSVPRKCTIAWLAANNSARYWLAIYVKFVAIGFDSIATDLTYTALAELMARTAERYFSRNYVKLLRQYGRYVRYVRYVRMETRHKSRTLLLSQEGYTIEVRGQGSPCSHHSLPGSILFAVRDTIILWYFDSVCWATGRASGM